MKDEIFRSIKEIKQHKKHGELAPHKPLLLLYALGQWRRGVTSISWNSHEDRLKEMLRSVKPTAGNMEEPFVRLAGDKGNLWEVSNYPLGKDPSVPLLRELNTTGRLGSECRKFLESQPSAIEELSLFILTEKFPFERHELIIQACGIRID